ncbi:MAG: PqiC family protein [Geobacteraceae bacterium]|nr:PqiC family protein [Geobacteraceae bacterium]
MTTFSHVRIDFCVLVLLALVLAACGTTHKYRYYTLGPVPSVPDSSVANAGTVPQVLGIGPVTIPDYLDRPQIVLRTSRNELVLSENSRWAGSLANDSVRVLEENLTSMLLADGIAVVSWRRGVPNDYRVAVQVSRFDAMAGGTVVLKAQWVIYGKNGKGVLLLRESDSREPVLSSGEDSVVEAMGRALTGLSREILQGLRMVRNNELQQ